MNAAKPAVVEGAMESGPDVSIVVPCRNEKKHIESCVRSLLLQEAPPGGLEIIVVDGISGDGTRAILEEMSRSDERLQVVDNPDRITPAAMNLGIRRARGRYIAILGMHSRYAPDYILNCVRLLEEHPEACGSGGPIHSLGTSWFGRAVAAAMSHPVGIGNAKHRYPQYEGYAEGACFPVFRREVFDLVGLFDEGLVRNQDDDLNFRVARTGGKVYISPRARCDYFVRETPASLFHQYYQYGFWRVAVLRKHGLPGSLRQLIPAAFVLAMLSAVAVAVFSGGVWRLAALTLPAAYICLLLGAGMLVAGKHGAGAAALFPLAAAVLHHAYGAGFIWGAIRSRRAKTETDSQKPVCHAETGNRALP